MADANEMYDTIMRELNDLVLSDTDESKEQQSFSFHEEAGFDDIPPSLLSYFETSKSRAAVCEKLILEDLEDFTVSHHTEDMTNLSIGLDKDMMKLNEQVICDPENEENVTSTDTRLLPAPTETETLSDRLCTHNVSLCPNNEDEAGTNMESEEHLLFETRPLDISLNDEERRKMSEYEEERKKRRYEEMKMEEHKRQIERDFQEELRKIMEAEKLHQKEIELMEKRAQEKLEQEFLLQQELISNLQRRVEEERRMREEEQSRMKRKREEEKVKMEAERKRKEEERRMREEEDKRKREEEKVKMEAERIRKEEERRMREEEDKRKREEEEVKMEAERKRIEEERRMREEEDKRKREEEKVKLEAERKRKEEERRMREEEDKRNREEEKVKMEAERKRQEEERRIREEEQRRLKEEEDKRKREEEKVKMEAERERIEEETRRKKEEGIKIEEMKLKKEQEERRRMEREEKWREEERIKIDLERRKLENEVRMMKEEQEKERAEEVERQKKEEEEKRKGEEEEGNKIKEATKEMEKMETERKMMIEIRLKKEEECRKKKERKDKEGRVTKEIEERKKQDGVTEKKKEADDRKMMAQEKMDEEMRNGDKNGNIDEEIKLERKKTEDIYRKRVEEKKDRKNIEEEKDSKEVVRNQEGENRKIKEERRPIVEDEKKNTDERKTEEEKRARRQTEKMRRPRDEDNYRKSEEDVRLKEENDLDNRKTEHESKTKDEQNKQEEEKRKRDEGRKNRETENEQNGQNVEENKEEVNKTTGEEMRIKEKEKSKNRMMQVWGKEVKVVKAHELQEKREEHSVKGHKEKKQTDKRENSSQREDSTSWSSSGLESIICPTGTEVTPQQQDLDKKISQTSARPSTGSVSLPVCLPEHTEQRRLSWMKDCIPWSKLSLQNRRKQKGSVRSRRGLRRAAEASSLPPLCPESLLQSTGWKSLQEVTTVTLEDLPGCSLSTLAQCTQLRSLSLRRCGLKSLEGINHLPQLCYIDVQDNDISFINCENMICLRVLKLGHNNLTSIHGLAGAENLDVLDLSHNSITRIAGLESVKRLQRLSVDHNQLISTKGLRDVYTLLHLNCSHNHLASVEGLENSALLNTLDLRANSLTEPPSLNNQVLLRELHLEDNSISSLQSLTACWLPLLQHLSVAQNRITQLPSISDFVSLENLDLQFNCISELQSVCESLEGCHLLQKIHLTGNPLQQESGWRSALQKAVPGLRVIDGQWTDSSLSPPAAEQVSLASGSFLAFCQAQLQQTCDLQQQHSRELSKASSSLDAVKISCQHFTEALQLAADQRFAHEYGDTNVADKHRAAGQTVPEETVDMSSGNADKHSEPQEIESTEKVPPVIPIRDNIGYSTLDEKSAAESRYDTFDTDATRPQTGPAVSQVNSGSVNSLATKRKTNSTNVKMAPVFNHQDLDRQIAAAVVIQQLWRKYRQKCGNISSPSTAEKGEEEEEMERSQGQDPPILTGASLAKIMQQLSSRSSNTNVPVKYMADSVGNTEITFSIDTAFWRGFTLRRRLASALAAVTCSDSGEDDTFEEVDMDEFVFDEAMLEKHWTLPLCEDWPLRRYPVSERPLSPKPPRPFPEPSQYILPPPVERKSKQAWVAPEQVDSERQGVSPLSSNRSKSPASTSAVSGLSKRSEKILEEWGFTNHHTALLMLKRAQNMKSKTHQQKRRREPSVRLALFRNCGFESGPVEARNRKTRHSSNDMKVRDVELGLQQAERTERVKQDQARQWLHNQAAHSDRDSESVRFLPEISSDILNGGRVQLVADPGYTERLHHASGLWANSSLTAQPCRENNYPRRNSLGHAREEVPSPRGATSAPSIKERISFRDNPVRQSGGWGGGKKRGKVYK